MKVLILGSGVIGVTTAYVLASRGHEVQVIDRQTTSGAETSFANGGQLSYSHAEPWANPAVLKKLPKWLLHEDSPLIFRLRADPQMVAWGMKFLRNCTQERADANCLTMLRLGLYSRLKFKEIREQSGIGFDYLNKGILHLYGTQKDLDYGVHHAQFQSPYGCDQTVLTAQEAIAMEPALAHTQRKLAGAIHSHMDESGDPYLYCNQLAAYCKEKFGVVFTYGADIQKINASGAEVSDVVTSKGTFKADRYVMAMGSYSPLLLRRLGIRVSIYPMKGYSVTVPVSDGAPTHSITDGTYKVVYSRLGNRLRVAGTAEFAGYDTSLNPKRITPIIRAASSLFPKADWANPSSSWACLRPSTPHGSPYLGKTARGNLFLNTGHGTLGWTQAAGSAYVVADIVENKTPEIALDGLTLEAA
jgi:D-amino-acid dehydrogenase